MRSSKSHFMHTQTDLRTEVLTSSKASTPREQRAQLQTLNRTQTSVARTKPVVASEEAEEQAQV